MSDRRRFLVDTTVLVDASHRREPVSSWLADAMSESEVVTSAVCAAELLVGVKDAKREVTMAFLATIPALPATFDVAIVAASYRREHRLRGVTILLPDALIAATAAIDRAVLVTANVKDVPMPDPSVLPLGAPGRGR